MPQIPCHGVDVNLGRLHADLVCIICIGEMVSLVNHPVSHAFPMLIAGLCQEGHPKIKYMAQY